MLYPWGKSLKISPCYTLGASHLKSPHVIPLGQVPRYTLGASHLKSPDDLAPHYLLQLWHSLEANWGSIKYKWVWHPENYPFSHFKEPPSSNLWICPCMCPGKKKNIHDRSPFRSVQAIAWEKHRSHTGHTHFTPTFWYHPTPFYSCPGMHMPGQMPGQKPGHFSR